MIVILLRNVFRVQFVAHLVAHLFRLHMVRMNFDKNDKVGFYSYHFSLITRNKT